MLAPEAVGGGTGESTEVNQELRGWDEVGRPPVQAQGAPHPRPQAQAGSTWAAMVKPEVPGVAPALRGQEAASPGGGVDTP